MSEFTIIAALSTNRVIGKDGAMPWGMQYSKDLKRFKKLTRGNIVICGRKTWQSITEATGKDYLPKRQMIVVSKTIKSGCAHSYEDNLIIRPALDQAVACAKAIRYMAEQQGRNPKLFVIGGGKIYNQMLPLVGTLELTIIEKEYEGDVFFPEYKEFFELIASKQEEGYRFETHQRKNPLPSRY